MAAQPTQSATIRVDAGAWQGELAHNWTYIGYDEINYTYVPEGQELLAKFAQMQEQPYYVRAHHLLCTGNCHAFYKWGSTNAYLEDDDGNPIYDWTIVDLILDTILRHHAKPFVEVGFMPMHLADPARYDMSKETHRLQNYIAYGWACPPKDYQKWHDLVYYLVRHCVERYGEAEIKTWYWELWNEPDLDYYWKGTIEEFNKLYDYTAAAVKAACPEARVGGPGTTNPVVGRRSLEYLDKFLDHCTNGTNAVTGQRGTPLDFTSFHVKGGGYRADPRHRKQNPPSVKQILSNTATGYETIRKYGAEGLECIFSEIDPDGWAGGGAWDNANLNFRNTEYYASFVADAFDKVSKFAKEQKWDLRLLTWAFMFVGERCFEGTRAFSTQGIDKAILNLFRMYAKMGRNQVLLESSAEKNPLAYTDHNGRGEGSDISGFAALSGDTLSILVYNHHDDWDMHETHRVALTVENHPAVGRDLTLTHYRVDGTHSNAYTEWLRQGKPMYPAGGQRDAIKARSGLEMAAPPQSLMPLDGKIKLDFDLPVHGVSLLLISPK